MCACVCVCVCVCVRACVCVCACVRACVRATSLDDNVGALLCGMEQVGPASGVLKKKPVEEWEADQVAETVLVDR